MVWGNSCEVSRGHRGAEQMDQQRQQWTLCTIHETITLAANDRPTPHPPCNLVFQPE